MSRVGEQQLSQCERAKSFLAAPHVVSHLGPLAPDQSFIGFHEGSINDLELLLEDSYHVGPECLARVSNILGISYYTWALEGTGSSTFRFAGRIVSAP